jgi:peptide/nickel transport system substrate-binding protein
MERRSLLKGVAGSALAVSITGLSGQALAQQGKKILVIASGQDIPNFDPHVATGYSASMLLRNTYDGLVRVEGNPPKVVPHLAASWTVSPDGLEYVFKLDRPLASMTAAQSPPMRSLTRSGAPCAWPKATPG